MLLVASPLLLLIFLLRVWSLLIWLVCVLVCFSLGLSCMGLFVTLGIWLTNSFSMLVKFSKVISSKIFSYHFLFFCEPYILKVGASDIVPEISETILCSFIFLHFLFFRSYFHHFIFQLTDSFFCLVLTDLMFWYWILPEYF